MYWKRKRQLQLFRQNISSNSELCCCLFSDPISSQSCWSFQCTKKWCVSKRNYYSW